MLTPHDLQQIQLVLQPAFNQINNRLTAIEERLDQIERRLDQVEYLQHHHTKLSLENQAAISNLQEQIKYLPTKDEYLSHSDQIYGELYSLRENHEHRLTKLETKLMN